MLPSLWVCSDFIRGAEEEVAQLLVGELFQMGSHLVGKPVNMRVAEEPEVPAEPFKTLPLVC